MISLDLHGLILFEKKFDPFYVFRALCLKVQVEKVSKIECIRRIRTDHGKEFKNSEFANF